MAVAFKAAKATLEECYDQIRAVGKATPSVVKRIQSLEDFTKYSRDYIINVCRTPKTTFPLMAMLDEEVDVLVIQNHIPFPEKWKRGVELNYNHERQLQSMMPSDITYGITSLLKFAPSLFNHPGNGKLMNKFTQTQLKGWMPYLLEEINRVKPKVVVVTSTELCKLLGLKMSNTKNRGEIHYSPFLDVPVIITMHPKSLNMIRQTSSGAMWGDDYYSVIRRDLWKASDIVNGRLDIPDLHETLEKVSYDQVTICETLEEVRYWTDFLLKIPTNHFTSWDLETNSLDPWYQGVNRFGEEDHARILTSQVGYRRPDGKVHSIVIPLWHRDNDYYDPNEAFEIHKEYLLRDSCKVGHNITFDICFLAATTGVRLKGTILDTLLALHSLDSGIKGCYGLKPAVWDYLPDSGLGGYEDLLMIDESHPDWVPSVVEGEELEDDEDEDL